MSFITIFRFNWVKLSFNAILLGNNRIVVWVIDLIIAAIKLFNVELHTPNFPFCQSPLTWITEWYIKIWTKTFRFEHSQLLPTLQTNSKSCDDLQNKIIVSIKQRKHYLRCISNQKRNNEQHYVIFFLIITRALKYLEPFNWFHSPSYLPSQVFQLRSDHLR